MESSLAIPDSVKVKGTVWRTKSQATLKINRFYVLVNGIYNWTKIGTNLKRERERADVCTCIFKRTKLEMTCLITMSLETGKASTFISLNQKCHQGEIVP